MRTVITSLFYIIAISVHLSSRMPFTTLNCSVWLLLPFFASFVFSWFLQCLSVITPVPLSGIGSPVSLVLLLPSWPLLFWHCYYFLHFRLHSFSLLLLFFFVIIALFWYCDVAFLALQFAWYSQCPCGSSGHKVNLKPSTVISFLWTM